MQKPNVQFVDVYKALEVSRAPAEIEALLLGIDREQLSLADTAEWHSLMANVQNRLKNRRGAFECVFAGREALTQSLLPDADWNVSARLSMASATIHQWRPDAEKAAFEVLLGLGEFFLADGKPPPASVFLTAAQLCWETARFNEAATLFECSARAAGQDEEARLKAENWRLIALIDSGAIEQANELFSELSRNPPKNTRQARLLTLSSLRLAHHSEDKVLDVSNVEEPKSGFSVLEYHETLGEVLLILDPERAIQSLERVIEPYLDQALYVRFAKAVLNKAKASLQLDDIATAFECLSRASNIIERHGLEGLTRAKLDVAAALPGNDGLLHITDEVADSNADQQRTRRYVRGPLIGQGGFARVYEGLDLRSGDRVAMKHLEVDLLEDSDATADVIQEVRMAARIKHPGVNAPIDLYSANKRTVIVSGLLRGDDLAISLQTGLEPDALQRIARQVAESLEAIHREGVVHGDLKPANIVLDERTHRAVIVDFGISRLVGDAIDTVRGTLGYIAPELLSAKKDVVYTAASDLYALGKILGDDLGLAKSSWFKPATQLQKMIASLQSKNPAERPQISRVLEALRG